MPPERQPAVAGRFYPGTAQACARALDELFAGLQDGEAIGAIVPHAGWVFSGRVAARGIAGLAAARPETVVIFGSVHVPMAEDACVFTSGSWLTPLGRATVDEELARRLQRSPHISSNPRPHTYEHSIEVEIPLVQRAMSGAAILPIMVAPGPAAPQVGRACAESAAELGRRVVFVGSTDLTHYGPMFGFEPHGHGPEGVRWAKEVNDRRLVKLIRDLYAEGIVPEATRNHNACGPGAVAAAISAATAAGANAYDELAHAASADRELSQGLHVVNSVGYEAGVFVRRG